MCKDIWTSPPHNGDSLDIFNEGISAIIQIYDRTVVFKVLVMWRVNETIVFRPQTCTTTFNNYDDDVDNDHDTNNNCDGNIEYCADVDDVEECAIVDYNDIFTADVDSDLLMMRITLVCLKIIVILMIPILETIQYDCGHDK